MSRSYSMACAIALLVAISLTGTRGRAHGGEDHGVPATPSAATVGMEHVVVGETDAFSVVVKYPAKKSDGALATRVYVARTDTSEPIADAAVRLELKGGVTLERDVPKTDAPGVYEVSFPAPPDGATADGIVSIQAKEKLDLVLIGKLPFGPNETETPLTAPDHHDIPPWMLAVAAGALACSAGTLGFALGRRSGRRTSPPDKEHALSEVTS